MNREKLYRKNDPDTSREAAYSLSDVTTLEHMVLTAIDSFGPVGCISDQVREYYQSHGLSYSSITARYKNLEELGLLIRGPEKRKGYSGRNQLVMRAKLVVDIKNLETE